MMSKAVHDIALNTLLKLRRPAALARSASLLIQNFGLRPFATRNVDVEHFDLLPIHNERLLSYTADSEERKELENALIQILNTVEKVPIMINGEEFYNKNEVFQILPYNIKQPVARYTQAHRNQIEKAIDVAVKAQVEWDHTKLSKRMAIWERAAKLIAQKYRFKIVAATMLGQGKTLRQAEIDVAELVDFLRINPVFLRDLANYEPVNDRPTACRNHMRMRGLTGFVAAISPFNYTSIAGNLAYTPALMGNAVLWKPSDSAILSNWYVFKALREAGVPDGVVNFVPAPEMIFASICTQHPKLAGVHFTGTAAVLKILWQLVAQKINVYENYPRLLGDCGGKNFHFVHSSADPRVAVACTVRAAFEYAGQKCSSCSMLYVPESMWEAQIRKPLMDVTRKLFVSEATYCDCFYSAVINKKAYDRIQVHLKYVHNNPHCEVLLGGTCSKKRGYYVDPTIVRITNLDDRLCKEELLAPILCVYVYKDENVHELMEKVSQINHGLSGSVFAKDDIFIKQACDAFKLNVGNLNINDKSTGSMVGHQPFGAGHMTGTNEKMGSPHYLMRWTSPQIIKESFEPHTNIYYPYMEISEKIPRVKNTNSDKYKMLEKLNTDNVD